MSRHISARAPKILCLALLLQACATPPRPVAEGARKILFIGNSLTYVNDLPGMLQGLAEAAGAKPPIAVESVAWPDFGLEEHLEQGDALAAIARGGWDVVILQQGPSSLEESRVDLRASAAKIAADIRKVGARPALYMVWPEQARRGDFQRVSDSYALAARDVGGLLFPVGEAWRRALDQPLYRNDGLHPTVAGSYLAALVIYAGLTGSRAEGLPRTFTTPKGERIEVPAEQAARLQAAADAVRGEGPSRGSAPSGP